MFKAQSSKWMLLIALVVASVGYSCDDYDCFYNFDYNVGSFGYDLGSYIDYTYTTDYYTDYSSYGGGCGSLYSTCGYGYDLGCNTNLGYSYDNYTSGMLNNLLYQNILQNNALLFPQMGNPGMPTSPGFPGFGNQPPIFTGGNPFPGPTYPTYPVSNPFPTVPNIPFPGMGYPTSPVPNVLTPPVSNYPTLNPLTNTGGFPTPPTTRPPYAGCDNITVMCPQGPTTRPDDLKRPPVYSPVTTTNGNDPVRYRVPRGVVTH